MAGRSAGPEAWSCRGGPGAGVARSPLPLPWRHAATSGTDSRRASRLGSPDTRRSAPASDDPAPPHTHRSGDPPDACAPRGACRSSGLREPTIECRSMRREPAPGRRSVRRPSPGLGDFRRPPRRAAPAARTSAPLAEASARPIRHRRWPSPVALCPGRLCPPTALAPRAPQSTGARWPRPLGPRSARGPHEVGDPLAALAAVGFRLKTAALSETAWRFQDPDWLFHIFAEATITMGMLIKSQPEANVAAIF